MSFFGFDTTLPKPKAPPPTRSAGGKFGPSSDDPFNPLAHEDDDDDDFGGPLGDDELDAKIRGLTAGAQEDVQIYEWGGEGYDGLGDRLDEAGDDLNDDTFGMGAGDVGKDFDFGHGPAAPAPSAAPTQRQQKPVDSMFASNFDDFWAVPSIARPSQQQQQPQQQQQQFQQQQPPSLPQQPAPARRHKTMEEIEAELRASSLSQQQQPPPARRPKTMDEIEAEMRAQRAQVESQPQPPPPGPLPPNLASMMQAHAPPPGSPVPAPQPPPASEFPPLGAAPSPGPGRAGIPPPPPHQVGGPPPPTAPAAMHPAQQAEHFARMQAMLRALPDNVQQALTALPPHMHFDVLQGVCREFPILLEPSNPAVEERQSAAAQAALGRFRMIAYFDRKRAIREAKIASMAKYNNIMTVSDKEFITRIQISQILPADPYADDFYAHIYFALRGRPGPNPGLMGAQPQQPQQQQQQPPQGPSSGKGSKAKQPKMNAQQKAMLRMQQQVERLVADRKQRIEKAAAGANPNLAGALGKVGVALAGNPRQALQINSGGSGQAGTTAGGTAADAVRSALEGARLGAGGAADAGLSGQDKRPPLTRHETLRILEKLYDIVLNLEQLRRSDDSGEEENTKQQELISTLWKELRILEPLDVSDPHPFISLLSTIKGKRLLPRVLRHLSSEQTLTLLTMIVASFDSLDVVREAHLLDDVSSLVPGAAAPPTPQAMERKRDVEAQAECFSNTVVPAMLMLVANSPMRIAIGMLALFVERNDVVKAVRSRAGIAFLTILLSRAESLRQAGTSSSSSESPSAPSPSPNAAPTEEEQAQWSSIFQLLFERLVAGSGGLSNLFPSTRAKASLPFGVSYYLLPHLQSTLDESDKDVWNLYAALAVSSRQDQQEILVQELREKILENVLEARGKSDTDEGQRKLRLVNIFLNALSLDASQITV